MKLTVHDLHQPGRIALDALSIEPGQCLVICGPNGSGKTSLLRVLAGVDPPHTGRVQLDERALGELSIQERAAAFAWLPQRTLLGSAWTVEALVGSARYRFSEARAVSEHTAVSLLHEHDLGHLVGRLANELSGGELQRVLIVSLIAQEASFLLLDEPGNHLDPQHQIKTYQLLGRLREQGKTLIIVSHDLRLGQLLGDAHQVRVLGIKRTRPLFDVCLADPALEERLSTLYETAFVPRDQPGGLAVDLAVVRRDQPGARS